MKKAVVYTSTTGNTEAMAKAVAKGAENSGAEVILCTADAADVNVVLSSDVIFLGSPAMGAEELEDVILEFYNGIENQISGKRIGIFGSYDWGDGQWLRDWADRIKGAGATVINGEGLMGQLTPDEACIAECEKLGAMN